MGIHPLLDLGVDRLADGAVGLHLGNGHIVVDAVLHLVVAADRQDLEQTAQHRDVSSRSCKGGGQIQPAQDHHKACGRGSQRAAEGMPAGPAPGLSPADARQDMVVQLLRDGGGLVLVSRALEFVHSSSPSKDTRNFFSPV